MSTCNCTNVYLKTGKKTTKIGCKPCVGTNTLSGIQNESTVNFVDLLQEALTSGAVEIPSESVTPIECSDIHACINVGGDITGDGSEADPISLVVPFKTCADILACINTDSAITDNADGTFTFEFTAPDGTPSSTDIDVCKLISDGQCTLFTINGTEIKVGDTFNFDDCCPSYDPSTGILTITNGTTVTDYQLIYDAQSSDDSATVTVTDGVIDVTVPVSDGGFEITNTTIVNGDTIYTITHTDSNGNEESGTITVPASDITYVTDPSTGTTTATITQDGVVSTFCFRDCSTGTGQPFNGVHELSCDWTPINVTQTGPDAECTFGITTYELVTVNPDIIVVDMGNGAYMVKPTDCTLPLDGTQSFVYEMFCDGVSQGTAEEFFLHDVEGMVGIEKDFSQSIVEEGDTIQITLIVRNEGTIPLTNVQVIDTLNPSLTYVSDNGGSLGTVSSTSPITWDIASLPVGATETLIISVLVGTAGFEAIANTATVTADEDPDTGYASDVVLEFEPEEANLSIIKTEITPPESRISVLGINDDGEVTMSFEQSKDGALINGCECSKLVFELVQAGIPVYTELEGDLCTPVENWDLKNGFDLRPYLNGSVANGNSLVFNKQQWAFDSGYTDETGINEFQNIRIYTYVGGKSCNSNIGNCEFESINLDNFDTICRTIVTGSDNQAFILTNDDGTTRTFSNYSQPYTAPTNPTGAILGSIVQAASNNAVIRLIGVNGPAGDCPTGGYWDVRHTGTDTITLIKIDMVGAPDINTSSVLTNTGSATLGYPNEIAPSIIPLVPGLNPVSVFVGSQFTPGNLECDGQVANWMKFTNCFNVGETLIYPVKFTFLHSDGNGVELIMNNNFLYGY